MLIGAFSYFKQASQSFCLPSCDKQHSISGLIAAVTGSSVYVQCMLDVYVPIKAPLRCGQFWLIESKQRSGNVGQTRKTANRGTGSGKRKMGNVEMGNPTPKNYLCFIYWPFILAFNATYTWKGERGGGGSEGAPGTIYELVSRV